MIRFPLLNIAKWDREGSLFCHVCQRKNKRNNIIVEMEWNEENKKGNGIEYEEWELVHYSRGANSSSEIRGKKKEAKKGKKGVRMGKIEW